MKVRVHRPFPRVVDVWEMDKNNHGRVLVRNVVKQGPIEGELLRRGKTRCRVKTEEGILVVKPKWVVPV